jgi:hypothetical protein
MNPDELAAKRLEQAAEEAERRLIDAADRAQKLVNESANKAARALERSSRSDSRNLNGSYQWRSQSGAIEYRVEQLEKDATVTEQHVDNLLDRMTARETAVDIKSIQNALQTIGHSKDELNDLRSRFETFQADRIKRLEDTNEQLNRVREYANSIETRVMERIDRNQIRSQQYVIGIVVGFVVTIVVFLITNVIQHGI